MTVESINKAQPTKAAESSARSTVAFPYSDQDAAIEVARGVHNAGGNYCDIEQLAAQLKMEAKGGGFRLRINGAQTFGLVTYERGGRISLTILGKQILDAATEQKARVDSFFAVPLYAKVYEEFKGGALPPQPALERAIVELGVGKKVADRARQALIRSAKAAGFFNQAADRLVKPSIRDDGQQPSPPDDRTNNENDHRTGGSGNGGGGGYELHPLIQGLLVTLPEAGKEWPFDDRANWLNMANSIFNAIYKPKNGDKGAVKIQREGAGNDQNPREVADPTHGLA